MEKYLIPLSKRNSALISAQSEAWRRRNLEAKAGEKSLESAPFITISRQFGCGAFPLAEAITSKLNEGTVSDPPWAVYDRALVERIAADHQLSEELVELLQKRQAGEPFGRVSGTMAKDWVTTRRAGGGGSLSMTWPGRPDDVFSERGPTIGRGLYARGRTRVKAEFLAHRGNRRPSAVRDPVGHV